jgi:hypothetical protein
MQDMRDFRDAKAMAHTLRAALAARGFKITISQSLELIAEAFGVADWNTLAAAIRQEAPTGRDSTSRPKQATVEWASSPSLSAVLGLTLHRALAYANQRDHEYATLEHLLLALIGDADASAVMRACKADLGALKEELVSYIDSELKELVIDDSRDPRPTPGFQRVVQRAVLRAQSLSRDATGADVLVAIFDERESHAAWFLNNQDIAQEDAANSILHTIVSDRQRGRGPWSSPRSS